MPTENASLFLIESGDLFLRDNQLESALACYTKAQSFAPNASLKRRLYNNLGVTYKRLGRLQEAKKTFLQGISLDASHSSFYSNLGAIYALQGNTDQAVAYLEKALRLHVKLADALKLMELYSHANRIRNALGLGEELLQRFPDQYDVHVALGNVYALIKQFDKALPYYEKAVSLAPQKTQALNNLGIAYKELGLNEKALAAYQKVIEIHPNDSAVYNNLGNLLRQTGAFEQAFEALSRSIKLNPSYADAYSNVGALFKEQKMYAKAEPYYQKALQMEPNHINANFDTALLALVKGNYEEGWRRYEYRLAVKELLAKTHAYKTPLWKGEPLKDKTIVLQNEQGFGDNIMFIRYAQKFLEAGAHVIVRTRPDLVRLFQTADARLEVIDEESSSIPAHDFYLPLLCSAQRFATTLETIPQEFPYFFVPKSKIDVALSPDRMKIGIVWSSSPTNKDFKNKHIGLNAYRSWFGLEGIQWISLHVGDEAKDIAREGLSDTIVDISPVLSDFYETAKVMMHLDLVITTDTAVAHLCGALNVPVWVLTPKPADWRWMQEGDTTPWYQSVKVFRQTVSGDWSVPIAAVFKALETMLKTAEKSA